jgi:hypothetical protein
VIFEHLPVFSNIVPSRLMVYAFLMASLLLALFVDHLVESRGRVLALGGAGLLAALVLLMPTFDFIAASHDDPAFFRAGGDAGRIPVGASVLVAPFVNHPALASPETWQVLSGMRFRVPSGYFLQPDPAGRDDHLTGPELRPLSSALVDIAVGHGAPVLSAGLRARMLEDLRHWRTQVVVVGPWSHDDEMVRLLADVLGRPPLRDQGVFVWWDVQPGQPAADAAAAAPMSPSYTYTSKRP